ncbi:MAG: hypothetical protein ACPGSB_06310 [Opitutales bacterium]
MTQTRTCPVQALDAETRASMWALFDSHYRGICKQVFLRDLDAKENAILLYDQAKLIGFTSLASVYFEDQRIAYSGDIIIEPKYRDSRTAQLFKAWAQAVWQKYDWWCLLSSGPRTCRIAHTFYRRVTPNPRHDETQQEREFRDKVAHQIYGDQYNRRKGIVQLKNPYIMRQHATGIRADYPYFAFFCEQNPGWPDGDELVSIISLKQENWKPVALRMLHWETPDGRS